jgi:FkbH-like protein
MYLYIHYFMIYYQSLQWLPKSDNKIIKKIKKNPKLCLNHSLINCRLDTEDDILLSNILHQNKKKLDAPNLKKINLNIISGSNISFMVKSVFLNCLRNNIFVNINSFEEYNLFESFISYQKKNMNSNENELIFLALDTLDFIEFTKKQSVNKYLKDLETILKELFKENKIIILQNLITYKNSISIKNVNKKILKFTKKYKVIMFDINKHVTPFSFKSWFDKDKYKFAKIPLSLENVNYYTYKLSQLINVISGGSKKVLVLDLDNTLWGGVIGDDGVKKIKIGNKDNTSKSFLNFQKFLKKLKSKGVLLAVCSKNLEKNAKEAFKKKNMPLKLNDFVSFKSNWNNKVSNIREISRELNLSLDSFVFFDDNPMERDIVRKNITNISVPEIDTDPSNYIRDIVIPGYFDVLSHSKEDAKRTQIYKSNIKRTNLQKKSIDINSYLKSLNMKSNMSKFKAKNIERIVQLFLRSNQFNLTTTRFQKKDIINFIKDKSIYTLQVDLSDKFGQNGIVSLIVGKILNNTLVIENWVMSCRVLSRTLEQAILNKIVYDLKKDNINKIIGIYKPSIKNKLVLGHYKNLKFTMLKINKGKTYWEFELNKHKIDRKKNFIKIINE